MILTAEDLFLQGPYLLLTARRTCEETQTRALLCKHCIFPNFETLPLHFIPRHPSPTQHLPRYLRVTSFLFVSCRSLTSSLTRHSAPLLGSLFSRASNPVTAISRPLFTPRSRPQRHASHVPRLGPARATWQNLLLRGATASPPCSPMGPALARRIPPGSGAYHRPTPFRDRSRQGARLGNS